MDKKKNIRIKILRHVAELTQARLAKKAKMSQSRISLIEAGKLPILSLTSGEKCRLAEALGVRSDDLFAI